MYLLFKKKIIQITKHNESKIADLEWATITCAQDQTNIRLNELISQSLTCFLFFGQQRKLFVQTEMNLAQDVLFLIVPFVDFKDLGSFFLVQRSWNNILKLYDSAIWQWIYASYLSHHCTSLRNEIAILSKQLERSYSYWRCSSRFPS